MPDKQTYYLTTSIAYVNGDPHIGYTIELLQADVLARWQRLCGRPTFFLTGTDENTLKLVQAAKQEGLEPEALADKYAARFIKLTETYQVSNDAFIRTTDQANHHPGAIKLWKALADRDLIYKGQYEGNYCIDCEQFYTDKEAADGSCPIHQRPLEHRSEENYLFKLSEFGDRLRQMIERGEYEIIPQQRRHEILEVLADGLRDVSFSRPADKLTMGVPVPGDDSQRMYVWCDALTNYITGIGYGRDEQEFSRWWPADLHMIGKDIIRFHAALWPAMLLGAGLPLPKRLYVHGFITADGVKMSKSKGNVIDPFAIAERFGVDAARYYLLGILPYAGDGDFSETHFAEVYTAELANDVGNLASRVLAMIEQNCQGMVPAGTADAELSAAVNQTWQELDELITACRFQEARSAIHRLASRANQYVDRQQPFKQTGQDQSDTLYTLIQVLAHLSLLYTPIMPQAAALLQERLGLRPADDLAGLRAWEQVSPGTTVRRGQPLFPKP